MMIPLQMCLDGLNWVDEFGAKLLFCNMPKNRKARHTRMAGPMGPRLDNKRQSCCRRSGRTGRHLSGGIHMVMSAALNRDATGNESTASGVSPSSLCKNLTPEM